MTARAFLTRGLLAGLLAGLAAFLVAHQVGEPAVERAIALEEAGARGTGPVDGPAAGPAAGADHSHGHQGTGGAAGGHSHAAGSAETEVSRADQRTWGLLTGTLTAGVALGGVVALVAAGVAGRLGRLTVGQSTALVSLVGFVAFALLPFLKYPANPPAVGSGETIGSRTASYFGFVLVSLLVAVAAMALATRLLPRCGAYAATLGGTGLYLVAMTVAALAFPSVNEVGDFPADLLWRFRLSSLLTLATLWAVIGVVLVGLTGRLHRQAEAAAARRKLAASL